MMSTKARKGVQVTTRNELLHLCGAQRFNVSLEMKYMPWDTTKFFVDLYCSVINTTYIYRGGRRLQLL